MALVLTISVQYVQGLSFNGTFALYQNDRKSINQSYLYGRRDKKRVGGGGFHPKNKLKVPDVYSRQVKVGSYTKTT